MSANERFSLLIAGMGLLFTVLTVGLGLIVRITRRWTKIEDSLSTIAEKIQGIVKDKDDDHRELSYRIEKVDSRIERHEQWHDDHPYMRESRDGSAG